MKITVDLSEEKIALLGQCIAKVFKLKKIPNALHRGMPLFNTDQGQKSYIGLGEIILATVEETIETEASELRKML